MHESVPNPYASPTPISDSDRAGASKNHLRPLWIWLAAGTLMPFFGTPADPVSMLIAMAYGLVSFCIGCVLGSSASVWLRGLCLVLWLAPSGSIGLGFSSFFLGDMLLFGLASSAMGVWACRSLEARRLRILASFAAGFIAGSFAGLIGTVGGAVLATLLANRSLPRSDASNEEQD
jgi:hypothetical protein